MPGLVLPGVVEYREQFVSSVAFYLAHGIVALPSEVLVDEYQVEFAVVGITVSLDIVVVENPVGGPYVGHRCPVVGIFVHIHHLTQMGISCRVCSLFRQFQPCVECIFGTLSLNVSVGVFEGIHLIVIIAIVGCAMVSVACLSQVEQSHVFSVEEYVHGLHILCVHHESAADDYLLRQGIYESATCGIAVVISSVANQYLLVSVVEFVGEELCVQALLSLIILACFYLEGGRHEVSAPSSRYLEFCLLVDNHIPVGIQNLHVYRTFPVHVPVGFRMVASFHAVYSVHIYPYAVIIQVFFRCGHGDDGHIVVLVFLDIRPGDHLAGKISMAQEHKSQDCGVAHGEDAAVACRSVGACGCASVRCISQGISLGDGHFHYQWFCEESCVHTWLRFRQTFRGKFRCGIGCRWRGHTCGPPGVSSVGGSCIGASGSGHWIGDTAYECAVPAGQTQSTAFAGEFQWYLSVSCFAIDAFVLVMVEEQSLESSGRNYSCALKQLMLVGVVDVGAYPHSRQRNALVCGVVEFYPAAIVE